MNTSLSYRILLLLMALLILISCQDDNSVTEELDLNGFSSKQMVTDRHGNTYIIGYDQVSSINQDPFIEKRNSEDEVVWRIRYEESPPDGKGELITLDTDNETPIAIFTIDGGSNDATYITRHKIEDGAFDNVFQNSYGSGGGPSVTIIARINPENGHIKKATFLTARLNNGNTNTLRAEEIRVTGNTVDILARSAAWPPGEGNSYQRFPNITDEDRVDGAFLLYYEFSKDFSEIKRAVLRRE